MLGLSKRSIFLLLAVAVGLLALVMSVRFDFTEPETDPEVEPEVEPEAEPEAEPEPEPIPEPEVEPEPVNLTAVIDE